MPTVLLLSRVQENDNVLSKCKLWNDDVVKFLLYYSYGVMFVMIPRAFIIEQMICKNGPFYTYCRQHMILVFVSH